MKTHQQTTILVGLFYVVNFGRKLNKIQLKLKRLKIWWRKFELEGGLFHAKYCTRASRKVVDFPNSLYCMVEICNVKGLLEFNFPSHLPNILWCMMVGGLKHPQPTRKTAFLAVAMFKSDETVLYRALKRKKKYTIKNLALSLRLQDRLKFSPKDYEIWENYSTPSVVFVSISCLPGVITLMYFLLRRKLFGQKKALDGEKVAHFQLE